MKKFFAEFKTFAMRGNVMDMAIGVVIGAAFGKITTSIVNDIIMPLIGLLIGGVDLGQLNIVLKPEVLDEAGKVVTEAVTLGIGNLLAVILDFIIVAFAMFLLVKAMNKLASLKKKEEEAPEEDPKPTSEELLTEIRDLLKAQQK
ncbi:MAG: large-conductance mechanosensitive channel protein MscL [Firmicutes bacterium]|nr:large-conductance mechanosensitive channel protein MscL [Bacillota bacterium]